MATIEIRYGTADDAEVIANLGRDTFVASFGPHNTASNMEAYVNKAFDVNNIRAEIEDPAATFLMASDGGADVGFAKLVESQAPVCVDGPAPVELERIYVASDRTGAGIGAPLLEGTMTVARDIGFQTLWLGVWEHNEGAIRFYRRHGFREIGTIPFTLGDENQTDIVMARRCP